MGQKVDYIIVGQGLAGSALALQCLNRSRKILVIDKAVANTASRVAVGLFNPITGRFLVKTWLADQLFPYLHTFYKNAELALKSRFFYPLPLYRPFATIEEQNEWMGKSADPAYQHYLKSISTSSSFDFLRDDFGGFMLNHCGYLDCNQYLEAVRNQISVAGLLMDEVFEEDSLEIQENSVWYKGYEATAIIFCQGMAPCKWFRWVPILPLKGETLRIESEDRENIIVNRGVYAVPANQNGKWRVGATYSRNDSSPGTTEAARHELVSKLSDLLRRPFSVIDQEWGIRPTTHDRKPVLGRHPEHKRLYILNGMGPKGVSLSPYFSEILIRSIENQSPLNKDVNIERYKSLYWSPSTRI